MDLTLGQIIGLFVQATPYGTILAFVVLLIVDVIGPSKLRKAAEVRADAAIKALVELTAASEKQTEATKLLAHEHEVERQEWSQELAGLQRELAALVANRQH